MRPFSAREVLRLWEQAATSQGVERALLPLAVAGPEQSWVDLARLPLGRRDALLLELYQGTFGNRLDLYVECPECGEDLELDLTADALQARAAGCAEEPDEPVELAVGDLKMRCRLPNSEDLAAAGSFAGADAARMLLQRCLLEASRYGEAISAGDLAAGEVAGLAAAISRADPFAELLVDLDCAACAHHWQAQIDIAECLWPEINAAARCLLREVHVLARCYCWSEADILAMSARRRRSYMEMLGL